MFGMSETFKFTLCIEGVGDDWREAWRDAVEHFAFDPGAAINGDVVYTQVGSEKPVPRTVDSLLMNQKEE